MTIIPSELIICLIHTSYSSTAINTPEINVQLNSTKIVTIRKTNTIIIIVSKRIICESKIALIPSLNPVSAHAKMLNNQILNKPHPIKLLAIN
jgi:hypothetical protein